MALLVPTSWYLAGCGAPEHVRSPADVPQVRAPLVLIATLSLLKLAAGQDDHAEIKVSAPVRWSAA